MLIYKKAVSVTLLILGLSFSGPSYANAENSFDDEDNFIVATLRLTSLMKFDNRGNVVPRSIVTNGGLGVSEVAGAGVMYYTSEVLGFRSVALKLSRVLGGAMLVQGIFTIGDTFYLTKIRERKY